MLSQARAIESTGAGMEEKLGLVEFLLTSTDLQACVRYTVDWLVSSVGVDPVVVLREE